MFSKQKTSIYLLFIFLLTLAPYKIQGMSINNTLKTLYPEPSVTHHFLDVDGASIHWQEAGNPNGIPVLFVHGGPGGNSSSKDLRFFNPDKYYIIAFDQRGCGLSLPSGNDLNVSSTSFQSLTINTLVDDIETLRRHLSIDKWLIFGGSWGSTLSLYYGQNKPENILGLILRGVYLCTEEENSRFFHAKNVQELLPNWNPESLELLASYAKSQDVIIDLDDPVSFVEAYYELCVLKDDFKAMHLWTMYEIYVDDPTAENLILIKKLPENKTDLSEGFRSIALFETLFFVKLQKTLNLLDSEKIEKLKPFETFIVQGSLDSVCPKEYAEKLKNALIKANCKVNYKEVPEGHHSPFSPAMTHELISFTDGFEPRV